MADVTPPLVADDYRQRIANSARADPDMFKDLVHMMNKPPQHHTRSVFLSCPDTFLGGSFGFAAEASRNLPAAALVSKVREVAGKHLKCLCIIENISPDMVSELGRAWDIDPNFFACHARNPEPNTLWQHRSWQMPQTDEAQHVHAIYECHDPQVTESSLLSAQQSYFDRIIFKDRAWPANVSTTISYYNISQPLSPIYLILVDASPLSGLGQAIVNSKILPKLSLRVPYAHNRGGLLLSSTSKADLKLFDVLDTVLSEHPWHLELILCGPNIFPAVPLMYLISCSIHETKLRHLEESVSRISYVSLVHPDWGITKHLHALRRELTELRAAVTETLDYLPETVDAFFESRRTLLDQYYGPRLSMGPKLRLVNLLERGNALHDLTVESFNILIGTVAVLGSEESRKQTEETLRQTKQSMLLTGLATVYLPLSLATGVFGMNLRELTGEGPRVWVFVLTAVLLTLVTMAAFGGMLRDKIVKSWTRLLS